MESKTEKTISVGFFNGEKVAHLIQMSGENVGSRTEGDCLVVYANGTTDGNKTLKIYNPAALPLFVEITE